MQPKGASPACCGEHGLLYLLFLEELAVKLTRDGAASIFHTGNGRQSNYRIIITHRVNTCKLVRIFYLIRQITVAAFVIQ